MLNSICRGYPEDRKIVKRTAQGTAIGVYAVDISAAKQRGVEFLLFHEKKRQVKSFYRVDFESHLEPIGVQPIGRNPFGPVAQGVIILQVPPTLIPKQALVNEGTQPPWPISVSVIEVQPIEIPLAKLGALGEMVLCNNGMVHSEIPPQWGVIPDPAPEPVKNQLVLRVIVYRKGRHVRNLRLPTAVNPVIKRQVRLDKIQAGFGDAIGIQLGI